MAAKTAPPSSDLPTVAGPAPTTVDATKVVNPVPTTVDAAKVASSVPTTVDAAKIKPGLANAALMVLADAAKAASAAPGQTVKDGAETTTPTAKFQKEIVKTIRGRESLSWGWIAKNDEIECANGIFRVFREGAEVFAIQDNTIVGDANEYVTTLPRQSITAICYEHIKPWMGGYIDRAHYVLAVSTLP